MPGPSSQHPYANLRKPQTENPPPPLLQSGSRKRAPIPSTTPTGAPSTPRGAPTTADIVASYARIPPRTKLYLALGFFAFASGGVYMTYKFEEWYPVKKRQRAVAVPDAKSQVDILWEEEERRELEKHR
ncbi:hypothetical protein PhCBS80983_g03177 [Powellomyces hirtus]|uniref:Uncharacterized protein n=1 Tax=Powellomyces hirtus TaxID=109895 RepID=A0A507E5J2_9FUNG|nr:hypothetical protein PhCBS80983_g03177 [Powellomyces hirtus]